MKTYLILLLSFPSFLFAQLSLEDIKSIDSYALNMCSCVYELLEDMHPKTVDVIFLMAEVGEVKAMAEVEKIVVSMSNEELDEFLTSFRRMEDPDFTAEIEDCDGSDSLKEHLKNQINNGKGLAHEYLMYVLSRETSCKLTKALYDLGAEAE